MEKTLTSILSFKGKISFEKIGILLNDLKNKRQVYSIHSVVYKKLLTVMIEVLENILKYSDKFDDYTSYYPEYYPAFELNMDETGFTVIARNPVWNEDMDVLNKKISRINSSDEDELKEFYRETITNGMFTEKGGAGLGLIEMAKIVDRKIEYRFEPAPDGYSIYELKLHINFTDHINDG